MLFVGVFLASLVIASFFGHVVHWSLHQKWSGFVHAGHMEHHLELYPVGKLTSDRYRPTKWYNNGALVFTPPLLVILGIFGGLLFWLGAPHWTLGVLAVTIIGFSLTNDYVHDSFHLRKHWLNRFKGYKRLRRIHYLHHHDMSRNFGIVWFGWDRVFGTKRTAVHFSSFPV